MKTIRKKGKWKTGEVKFVIEENGDYVKTLPTAEELYNLLRLAETSSSIKEEKKEKRLNEPQKFLQPLLNEPTEQDVEKSLMESARLEQEKIMKEILQ